MVRKHIKLARSTSPLHEQDSRPLQVTIWSKESNVEETCKRGDGQKNKKTGQLKKSIQKIFKSLKFLIFEDNPFPWNANRSIKQSSSKLRASLKSSDYFWPKPEPVAMRDGP